MEIIVIASGWVVVGRVVSDGEVVRLEDAKVVRRWGTSHGIGELATGPTPHTVLDPLGTVAVTASQILFRLAVAVTGW